MENFMMYLVYKRADCIKKISKVKVTACLFLADNSKKNILQLHLISINMKYSQKAAGIIEAMVVLLLLTV